MRQLGLRYWLGVTAFFALYVAAGKFGLALATVHASASAVWPPTGIAIASALLLGRRLWPAIWAGAFVVNATNTADVASSIGIATGNTLEAIGAVTLIARLGRGRDVLYSVPGVLAFTLAVAAGAALSASLGLTSLLLTGLAHAANSTAIWLTWWLGDVGGAFVVTPLLLLWAARAPRLRSRASTAELALLGLSVALVAFITFTPYSPAARMNYPIGFLVFPVLAWSAVRFGPRLAVTTVALLAAVAVWGSEQQAGPWVRGSPNESLLLLGGYVIVAALTSLLLGSAMLEREEAEERRRAADERLRRAVESKVAARDEVIAIAAHELRGPLTSLQLAAQYVLRELEAGRDPRHDRLREVTEGLGAQTRRMRELVDRLLDTVRAEADRMGLSLTRQDVAALARGVAQEVQATTARHEIRVDAPAELAAEVDALRIEQVLRNLLDNAVKFAPGGRIDVHLRLDGDTHFELSVRDRGPGIAPSLRGRIFDRFFAAREPSTPGLGLGLHLCRRIVELHGGAISAEFPEGGGTRIVARLPVRMQVSLPLEAGLG